MASLSYIGILHNEILAQLCLAHPSHIIGTGKKPFQSRKDGLTVQGSREGTEGEIQVDLLSFKSAISLWHSSRTTLLTTKIHRIL